VRCDLGSHGAQQLDLAVDADPKSRRFVGPSVRPERRGQLDLDAILLEFMKLLLFAVDRHVRFDVLPIAHESTRSD
jgi:hypothetical protein